VMGMRLAQGWRSVLSAREGSEGVLCPSGCEDPALRLADSEATGEAIIPTAVVGLHAAI
jgi:hypothetical protein